MKGLIDACNEHLDMEEQVLGQAEQAMHSLRNAIGAGDAEVIEGCLQDSDTIAKQMSIVKQRRSALRGQMAVALGVDDRHASVSDVIRLAPAQAASNLRLKREHVQQLSRRVETLTLSTAALVKQNLDIYQHILCRLTGTDAAATTYSRTGRAQATSCHGGTRARC